VLNVSIVTARYGAFPKLKKKQTGILTIAMEQSISDFIA